MGEKWAGLCMPLEHVWYYTQSTSLDLKALSKMAQYLLNLRFSKLNLWPSECKTWTFWNFSIGVIPNHSAAATTFLLMPSVSLNMLNNTGAEYKCLIQVVSYRKTKYSHCKSKGNSHQPISGFLFFKSNISLASKGVIGNKTHRAPSKAKLWNVPCKENSS